jgi:hypothetical protein
MKKGVNEVEEGPRVLAFDPLNVSGLVSNGLLNGLAMMDGKI